MNFNKAVEEYNEAKAAGVETRPVVLGPISFLVLGKADRSASPNFNQISLLEKLIPVYKQLLAELKSAGVEWVQIDEPVLVLDAAAGLEKAFTTAYSALTASSPKIVLATYFGRLESNLAYVAKLPIAGLHVDLDREPSQLDAVIAAVKPTQIILSLGVVSGRNIWKNDMTHSLKFGQKAVDELSQDRVIIATSSSLLHCPVTLASEKALSAEHKDWFSFALEKAAEVATLAASLSGSQDADVAAALEANKTSIAKRREFERTSDPSVRDRVSSITDADLNRKSPFPKRLEAQKTLDLPKFPTTTIGSFPVCCNHCILYFFLSIPPFVFPSKRKKFVQPDRSSGRRKSLLQSMRISSRKRSTASSASRRKSALTCLSMVNLSGMTWFNTSANSCMVSCSLKMPGCRVMGRGTQFY